MDIATTTKTPTSKTITCRMYEQAMPRMDEVVMVCFSEIGDAAVFGTLPEYNHLEGMLMFSELSRKRIKVISSVLTIGKTEPCVVVRVDEEKRYIDLSRRRVQPADLEECKERYQKSYRVHNIFQHLSTISGVPVPELYQKVAWPLAKSHGHAYDGLLASISNPDTFVRLRLSEHFLPQLSAVVHQRMTSGPVRQRARVSIECFKRAGIDAIEDAIRAGLAAGAHPTDPSRSVKIWLCASPIHEVSLTTNNPTEGSQLLQRTIDAIGAEISRQGGQSSVVLPIELVRSDGVADSKRKGDKATNPKYQSAAQTKKQGDGRDKVQDDSQQESGSDSEENEEGITYELEEEGVMHL